MTDRDPDLTHPDDSCGCNPADGAYMLSCPVHRVLPTSALLRQTQAANADLQRAFAASQADLTKALDERDLARAELASARQEIEQLRAELDTRSTDPTQEKP